MASENETVEEAINRLKHRFDCPNDTNEPIKGEWCGACREICTADGKNWCDRNSYLNDVLAIESAWRREKAELQLAISAEKARHTDDYKDERIRAQDAEIATLNEILKLAKDGLEAADDIIHIWCQNPALDGHAKLNDRVRKALAKVAEGGEK